MKSLNDSIRALKREQKWLVRQKGKDIELARTINGRPIFITLEKKGRRKNRFHLVFPSYIFHSHNAHFGPSTEEVRVCRNKALLRSLIKTLKKSCVWDMIDNQGFLVVNDDNARSDKQSLKKELQDLYGWDPDAPRKKPKKKGQKKKKQ